MKRIAILVLFTTIALAGCKSLEYDPMSDSASLQFNSEVKMPGISSGELKVALLSLKDTRCPQNVICIQPGWVELSLLVRDQSDSVRVDTIFHGSSDKDKPKGFSLGGHQYALRIYRVLPLPTEGKKLKIEDYTVDFNIVPQ